MLLALPFVSIVLYGVTVLIFGWSWGLRIGAGLLAIMLVGLAGFCCWVAPMMWRRLRSPSTMASYALIAVGSLLGTTAVAAFVLRGPDHPGPHWLTVVSDVGATCAIVGFLMLNVFGHGSTTR